ncbi:hypothetical protein KJ590_02635 [Patescibacteria group bacterium]|nr:hypothetical protein [Patescibacteria group bacterium]
MSRRHKRSHFWQCRKCGCEKNVQGRCRVCGCLFQDSQKIKTKGNNYGQPRLREVPAEKNLASGVQKPEEDRKKINVRKMVKLHRRAAIAAYLSASKNHAVAANMQR